MTLDDMDKALDRYNDYLHYTDDREQISSDSEQSPSVQTPDGSGKLNSSQFPLRSTSGRDAPDLSSTDGIDTRNLVDNDVLNCKICGITINDKISKRLNLCLFCRTKEYFILRSEKDVPTIQMSIWYPHLNKTLLGVWGTLLRYKDKKKIFLGRSEVNNVTSDDILMTALGNTLKQVKKPCNIEIFTKYVGHTQNTISQQAGFCPINFPVGWIDVFLEFYKFHFEISQGGITEEDKVLIQNAITQDLKTSIRVRVNYNKFGLVE